jgi:hypothetical protein
METDLRLRPLAAMRGRFALGMEEQEVRRRPLQDRAAVLAMESTVVAAVQQQRRRPPTPSCARDVKA